MIAAIIVAGGSGERLGRAGGKQMVSIAGLPVLAHAVRAFGECDRVDCIVVVAHPDRVREYEADAIAPLGLKTPTRVVPGGATRIDSVRAGLAAVPETSDIIVVHDGARPLVTASMIAQVIEEVEADDACAGVVVGHPSYDTLKTVDGACRVLATPDRATIWSAQTPQAFRARALFDAYDRAMKEGWSATDDSSLVERLGGVVRMLAGPRDNVKVTVPEDLPVVEGLLRARRGGTMEGMRIGTGFDVHAFAEGRPLVLGGVVIPSESGLAGHSDADVLVHAVMDAIVGAMREGDIGRLFPDTDPAYAGISSIELLRRVAALMRDNGWRLLDADTVLVLEAPRIAPYREQMRAYMAEALGVDVSSIGVKATTTERLGFTGRQEGAAAHAVVLLGRDDR